MLIAGLQKLTLLDFPGKTACTVFTPGCNFRCPFCHNALLVTDIDGGTFLDEEEFFSFLNKRKGILEGVAITGGEPTLQRELPLFIKRIKDLGFLVKLDTNGTNPEMLGTLIEEGLVDRVAMDVKNDPALLFENRRCEEQGPSARRALRLRVQNDRCKRASHEGEPPRGRPLDRRGERVLAPAVQRQREPHRSAGARGLRRGGDEGAARGCEGDNTGREAQGPLILILFAIFAYKLLLVFREKEKNVQSNKT